MRQALLVKAVVLSALGAAACASAHVAFDVTALDGRAADSSPARRDRHVERVAGAALSDADLVETHARPLFSRNRRPFVPPPQIVEQPDAGVEAAAVEPAPSLPRRLLLLGTNVDGRAASALVRNMDSEEVRWLRVGESFDGWRLSAMSADQARFVCQTFEGEDCAYTLSLYSDGGERQ